MFSSVLVVVVLIAEPPLPPTPPVTPTEPEVLFPQPPTGRIIDVPPPPPIPGKPRVVPTVREFVASFQPVEGVHDVTIRHPFSGKPVDVTFRLPPGKPKKVYTTPRGVIFEYDRKDVLLIFRLFGGTDVRYY